MKYYNNNNHDHRVLCGSIKDHDYKVKNIVKFISIVDIIGITV